MFPNLLYLGYLKDCYLGRLYCSYLRRKRKKEELPTIDDFNFIKKISGVIYPDALNAWKNCETLDDYISVTSAYGLEQVYVYRGDNWYVIAVDLFKRARLVDFAAADGKCTEFWHAVVYLRKCFKNKKIDFFSREITSYPILKAFEKRKRIEIIYDKCIVVHDEFFHELTIKVIEPPKHRKKSK